VRCPWSAWFAHAASSGAPTQVTSIAVSAPPVDDDVFQRRYPHVQWETPAADADLFEIAASFHRSARDILIADGYHVTLAWLLRDRQPVSMHQLNPRGQRDKYLMIEQLAEEATELGADGLIITSEAWEAIAADPRAAWPSYEPASATTEPKRSSRTRCDATEQLGRGVRR
jgi:hypothetical protein